MRKAPLLVAAFMAISGGAYAESELVIAIRYLQAKGTSHSHLYLYREDGKLLRDVNVSARSDVGGDHVAPKLGVRAEFDVILSEAKKLGSNLDNFPQIRTN